MLLPFLSVAVADMPVLTREQALAYSQAHQPELRRAQAELAAQRGAAEVPRAAWLPRVGATLQLLVGTTNNTTASVFGSREVDLPRIGATPSTEATTWSPSPSTLVAVGVQQQVWDFGRTAAQIAVADAQVRGARQQLDSVVLAVRASVEESFAAVRSAQQVLRTANEAARRAGVHRDLAEAGVRSGLRPPIDRTRAQADVARAQVQVERAESGLAVARAALAAAIGSPAPQVDAAAGPDDDAQAALPALSDLIDEALRRSPELQAARAREDAQRATTQAQTRALLPNLSLSGTLSGRAGGAQPTSGPVPAGQGLLPSVGNWDVALLLNGPLFDGQALARRRAARLREDVAQADTAALAQNVRLFVERAYLDLGAAQRVIPALLASTAAARANLDQAEARFRAGLATIVELTDAEGLLVQAQLEVATGRFQLARARALFGRALGNALSPEIPPAAAQGAHP